MLYSSFESEYRVKRKREGEKVGIDEKQISFRVRVGSRLGQTSSVSPFFTIFSLLSSLGTAPFAFSQTPSLRREEKRAKIERDIPAHFQPSHAITLFPFPLSLSYTLTTQRCHPHKSCTDHYTINSIKVSTLQLSKRVKRVLRLSLISPPLSHSH